ncbi:unnamed protein product [Rotaria sordida]|uniref:Uncharacterized protein n=1 Tax=Rotaria sordida TaxID=392033 RepID=A0A813WPT5_9BILA|nr:unnamed protein product [Rotaria sordida]CAF1231211.1 unnamed protein product [Rotaria sordida]
MSSSSTHYIQDSDGKLATESSPPGMNSITNTVGMHPSTNQTLPSTDPSNIRRSSCEQHGCTSEHSGKPHA